MTTLLIRGRAKQDMKILRELAERLGLEITYLSAKDKEEIGMLKAIQEGRGTPLVSRKTVMRALRKA